MRWVSGQLLDERYRITSFVGRGGMGEVYQAEDLKLDQTVALKCLPVDLASDATWRSRFLGEVRIARQVAHPNVCRVFDAGEADGRPFLSMEFIEGRTLSAHLNDRGRLPHAEAIEVAGQICAGLAAIHDRDVLHRDLKPSNVMIDERGVVRITDFGVAVGLREPGGLRGREGTPMYMSPEQLGGEAVSVQSDLYALGLVLYEIFAGARPYSGDTPAQLRRAREEPPPPVSRVAPDVDNSVDEVIQRCLSRDPHDRPPSAAAVASALPGDDRFAMAAAAAQRRADRVAAFRAELIELRRAGAVELSDAQLASMARYHEGVLRDLTRRFDVDTSERGKQLSLGMRVVSLLGALALAASVYYFFYRIWGLISTPLQVSTLMAGPMVGLVATTFLHGRERSGYFAAMAGLFTVVCLGLNVSMLWQIFNLTPSPEMLLPFVGIGLLLGYACGLRLLVTVALAAFVVYVSARITSWNGAYFWPTLFARPENFIIAGLLVAGPAVTRFRDYHREFGSIFRVVGLISIFLPVLLLANFGVLTYFTLSLNTVEVGYQLAGFVTAAAAVWIGIKQRWQDTVNVGVTVFVILLFNKFIDWWWDWMPKFVFFFIVAMVAVGILLLLKRYREVFVVADGEERWRT